MIEVFIDGASRGNPGLSGLAVVIYDQNKRILTYREFIGWKTNNQTEYQALRRALQVGKLIASQITIFSDSNLLVNQRLKKFKIRNSELKNISREIDNLENSYEEVKYSYISRTVNKEADFEANRAIDDYIKYVKSP